MTDVNVEDIKKPEKKKVLNGYFFLSFVPFGILLVVQSVATLPGMIMAIVEIEREKMDYEMAVLMEVFNSKYALPGYLAYCVISLVILIPWYYKACVKPGAKVRYKRALGAKPVLKTLALMLSLYFVITAAFILADMFVPKVMEEYSKLMNMTSLGSNLLITVLYGYILGPITEEMCFRGVMFGLLEKSRVNHMIAIFVQAALFAIMHMNLVQGIYALGLGMVLGYLRYRYKTIFVTIGAHMVFNFLGVFVEQMLDNAGLSNALKLALGAVGLVAAVVLMIFTVKDKETYTMEQFEPQTIS